MTDPTTRPFVAWDATAPGVVELPDGRLIRGRGLSRPIPDGAIPEYGVYLLGEDPGPMPWESRWLPWRDFGTPRSTDDARHVLIDAYARCATQRVELACHGGIGRTGSALAAIAILAGIPREDAVRWVRAHYNEHAVETPFQRRWIQRRFLPLS